MNLVCIFFFKICILFCYHQPQFGFVSKNPVLKNITDYLVEEGSFEEDELIGGYTDSLLACVFWIKVSCFKTCPSSSKSQHWSLVKFQKKEERKGL